jgi:hypothetical protein
MPERSKLYSLEPIGVGTGEVESITSYLSRLANAHTVSTWALLRSEIGPRLFHTASVLRSRLGELVATTGAAFNGENATSRNLVSILQSLTCREDLHRLTMGFCRGFISSRFLVGVNQTWCPDCLREWKLQNRPIYWPLLWQVMAVKICPRHRLALHTACPFCGREFYPLAAHGNPGHCGRCGQWLGALTTGAECNIAGQEKTDCEIGACIAEFLQKGQTVLAAAGSSLFPKNTQLLVESHFEGNVQALARFLGVNRYTVVAWKNGTQSPSLLLLADVSRKVKVAAERLLCADLQKGDFDIEFGMVNQPPRRRFVAPPKLDYDHIRQVLEEAAKDDGITPASLSKLAAQLGCRQTTLQRRFPDLVNRIKANYQQVCAIRKEVRAKLFRSIVRMTTIDIHRAGEYPSQHRVRAALPEFIDMRDAVAHQQWKQSLTELGFGREELASPVA